MRPDRTNKRHKRSGAAIAASSFKRCAQALLTLLGASVLIWAMLPLAPGDPALRTLQALGIENPREAEVEAMRRELQLDRPLWRQYGSWLSRALRGDLSVSWQSGRPVLNELLKRLPATARLALVTLLLSLFLALTFALIAAAYAGGRPDSAVKLLTQLGASVPPFLLGLLLLQFVVLRSGVGRVLSGGSMADVWLPAFCLAIGRAAEWAQLLRAGLIEALGARYTLVAAARGATKLRLLVRYALPNALLPFLSVVGTGAGYLIAGVAIIEAVFTWPGLGSYVISAITARDMPVIQGFVIFSTLTFVTATVLADIVSAIIDPRLREVARG
jgi:ABC-type dipeptide/oligopeptide/nickel transport system permease component